MFEIITVCTGNVCRSPLAEQLLRARLSDLDVRVASAGTRGLASAVMTPEAAELAARRGIADDDSARHRSRFLTEGHLLSPDLILTMTREHRRLVAELAPSRVRSIFTIREFARLAADTPDADIRDAADAAENDASARVRAAAAVVASRRGLVLPPVDPDDDDVIDPYGRSAHTYELSGAQLDPGVDAVVRVMRLAVTTQ